MRLWSISKSKFPTKFELDKIVQDPTESGEFFTNPACGGRTCYTPVEKTS